MQSATKRATGCAGPKVYDAANRMKTAGGTNYGFDGDGRRVRVQQGGYSSIYYLWSSVLGQPVAEIVGDTGNLFQAYVYGPGGQMLALLSNDGGFYWSHQDHLGSGRKLTDSTGAVRYRGEFDPHGQVLLEVTSGGTGTYASSHKYTGYEREWSTNLDYAQARMFNHNRARFMQPDPLGLGAADLSAPQTLNSYSYVANDPVNFVDPSGLLVMFCETRTYETCIAGDCSRETITTCTVFAGGPSGGGGGEIGLTGGGGGGGSSAQNKRNKKPPCPPSATELLNNQQVRDALNQARSDSQAILKEEGGWIYWNTSNGKLSIRRAKTGDFSSIDLNFPLPSAGTMIIATFHTHAAYGPSPNFRMWGAQVASGADTDLAYARNVPSLIAPIWGVNISTGPERAGSDPSSSRDMQRRHGNDWYQGVTAGYIGAKRYDCE